MKGTSKDKFIGVSTWEIIFYISFFVFSASFYYTALWLNHGGLHLKNDPFFNFRGFLNWGGIDYFLKLLLSIPVWWLIFVKLRRVTLHKRLLIHLVILPLFVITWIKSYYLLLDALKMIHLRDWGSIWDLYLPALFYIMQFGIIHAYVYFKQNQENQKTESALREAALKSELSSLKAQLNPHFLYNVFNTISASIPPELENTRQMIAELADLFRYQLQASRSELVPLRDEIDFTQKYLDLEKARFQERLHISIAVEEELMNELIPPMILQPLAENAVKHGISPLINGGKIVIQVKRKEGGIEFSIADTGAGVKDKSQLIGKGVGLTNTALRLEKMYGARLSFTDTIPSGLTIKFRIG
ncbi:sensor histidine kinase [Pedobacter sp. MR2016-24]|uniref:sensor histidine kinase n=1 Tax=Pedobacter sp. MR2016-24 TaxID=2994466 RepID=UPI0022465F93|nr:histidine kinase [Pedobacter sp. MR2016-24]MCX2483863.1 histidine kinase [Pedobacter sp. MR2016-24]